jgi:hypothetical protein
LIHDGDAGEKILKVFVVKLHPLDILGKRGLFKVMTDRTDLVEPISAAVAFHTMAQKTDSAKVSLLETGCNRLEVSLPIGEKTRHNRFQVGIDVNDDPFRVGIRLWLSH